MSKLDIFYQQLIVKGGYILVIKGLGTTILLSFFALIIGFFIGTLVALLVDFNYKTGRAKYLTLLVKSYVTFFRGTPIVVQLLFIYFVIFPLMGLGGLSALFVAVLIFGLNSGAYVSEIIRSGLLSVDKGQEEAARSLGLNFSKTTRLVIFPQAIKNALPALGNEFVSLLKETSVANYITVNDLTYSFKVIGAATYEYTYPYFCLAIMYLSLVMGANYFVKKLEGKLRESDRA